MAGKPGDRSDEPRRVVDMRAEPEDGDGKPEDGRYDHVSLPSNLPPMNALTSSKWEPDEAASSHPELEPIGEVTVLDPRLEELETMIGRGDWGAIAAKLGPFENAGTLPPQLGLIYAIAENEVQLLPRGGRVEANNTTDLALRCVASMCNVPEQSGFALVIAKRLLRKNPTTFRGPVTVLPAPKSTSPLLLLAMLVVGAAVGWLVGRVLHL